MSFKTIHNIQRYFLWGSHKMFKKWELKLGGDGSRTHKLTGDDYGNINIQLTSLCKISFEWTNVCLDILFGTKHGKTTLWFNKIVLRSQVWPLYPLLGRCMATISKMEWKNWSGWLKINNDRPKKNPFPSILVPCRSNSTLDNLAPKRSMEFSPWPSWLELLLGWSKHPKDQI